MVFCSSLMMVNDRISIGIVLSVRWMVLELVLLIMVRIFWLFCLVFGSVFVWGFLVIDKCCLVMCQVMVVVYRLLIIEIMIEVS